MRPDVLRQYVKELSWIAECHVNAHPNAGQPNEFGEYNLEPDDPFGEYDLEPDDMALHVAKWASSGFLNIIGGCCGSSPEHIAAIATAVADVAPNQRPDVPIACRLSGLEPLTITADSLFVNVGERANVTGSAKFKQLILNEEYEVALDICQDQVENGAQIVDVNMDEGMLDGKAAMVRFLNLVASEPDILKVPLMIDSSKWPIIEVSLRCSQGKRIVNSILMKEGKDKFPEKATVRCSHHPDGF